MPNPKRRHSQRRTSSRRAHDHLKSMALVECPQCHEKKLPHRICLKCGYYYAGPKGKKSGREIIEVAAE